MFSYWKVLIMKLFLFSFPTSLFCQTITTVAGNGIPGYSGDGGPATSAKVQMLPRDVNENGDIVTVGGVAFDRIRLISMSGTISTIAGTSVGGYSGDGGAATIATLKQPYDAVFDHSGNIYIADLANYRIRKIEAGTGIIQTFAGNGIVASTGDGGLATDASLIPYALCIDKYGNIYFVDNYGSKVRKIDIGGVITTVAGTGIGGYSGDGGPATNANLTMDYSIFVDTSGSNLYLACNTRIRKVDISTGIINTIAGTGIAAYSGDAIPATSASFNVTTMCYDKLNNIIYILDQINDRIHKIDPSGIFYTVAGTGATGYNGDNIKATDATIFNPEGGVVDACGNLIFGDKSNYRIRKVTFNPTCNPAGVKEALTPTHSISLYPNPANTELTITATEKINTLQVTNTLGQPLLYRQYPGTEQVPLDVSHLPPGLYILRINGTHIKRFTKQ